MWVANCSLARCRASDEIVFAALSQKRKLGWFEEEARWRVCIPSSHMSIWAALKNVSGWKYLIMRRRVLRMEKMNSNNFGLVSRYTLTRLWRRSADEMAASRDHPLGGPSRIIIGRYARFVLPRQGPTRKMAHGNWQSGHCTRTSLFGESLIFGHNCC